MLEVKAGEPKEAPAPRRRRPKAERRLLGPKIPRLPGSLPPRPTEPVVESGRYALPRRDLIAALAARDEEPYYAATYAIIQALSVEVERFTGMHRSDAVRVADALRRRRTYARWSVDGPNLNAIAMSALLRPRAPVSGHVRRTIRYTIHRARIDVLVFFATVHPTWLTDEERELLLQRNREKKKTVKTETAHCPVPRLAGRV